ncbi:S49 family peptidase [Sphingomonas sp. MS122]|uniref:S49 family peptidase n=1 Tax=Sphingomonas sp. MS122 TaxID=3412683 RepID=UPI003C2CF274
MKYLRILSEMSTSVWAIEPEKFAVMAALMARQAKGEKFDDAEIEARIAPGKVNATARKAGAVAVLPVRGVISARMSMMNDISGGTSAEQLDRQLAALVNDDAVKAIILDVDSPGGSVGLIDEFAASIIAARGIKPIIAQVNPTSASAAYWIASCAEEVVVTPSGSVGSIGVFAVHEDISKALEMEGITPTLIRAGTHKAEELDLFPLTPEAKEAIQARVDASYASFVNRVAEGRGRSTAEVREGFGQGRMVLAKDAVKLGMADRVGTLAETLERFGVGREPSARGETTTRPFAMEREKRRLALLS